MLKLTVVNTGWVLCLLVPEEVVNLTPGVFTHPDKRHLQSLPQGAFAKALSHHTGLS